MDFNFWNHPRHRRIKARIHFAETKFVLRRVNLVQIVSRVRKRADHQPVRQFRDFGIYVLHPTQTNFRMHRAIHDRSLLTRWLEQNAPFFAASFGFDEQRVCPLLQLDLKLVRHLQAALVPAQVQFPVAALCINFRAIEPDFTAVVVLDLNREHHCLRRDQLCPRIRHCRAAQPECPAKIHKLHPVKNAIVLRHLQPIGKRRVTNKLVADQRGNLDWFLHRFSLVNCCCKNSAHPAATFSPASSSNTLLSGWREWTNFKIGA